MSVRVLFFGTPAFAVPSLRRVAGAGHVVAGVVTQPDRPRGRGRHVAAPPVKTEAIARGLTVLQPTRFDAGALAEMSHCGADLAVVAAYGRILPQAVLDVCPLGAINVHASLLPRWRGAAPVQRAILAGDAVTGVTIMRVVRALDAGPMLARVDTPIAPDETSEALEARLSTMGADLLVHVIESLTHGALPEVAQDEALVTYARRIERSDSRIDWARPALAIHNQIRGLQPWPLAGAMLGDRRVMFLRAEVAEPDLLADGDAAAEPGTILEVEHDALRVAARPGRVRILELQEAGRAALSVRAYLNGRRVSAGDRFTPLPVATS